MAYVTRNQLAGGMSVVFGIFLFKSLSLAPVVGDFLQNNWQWVSILSLVGLLFSHTIAGWVIKT